MNYSYTPTIMRLPSVRPCYHMIRFFISPARSDNIPAPFFAFRGKCDSLPGRFMPNSLDIVLCPWLSCHSLHGIHSSPSFASRLPRNDNDQLMIQASHNIRRCTLAKMMLFESRFYQSVRGRDRSILSFQSIAIARRQKASHKQYLSDMLDRRRREWRQPLPFPAHVTTLPRPHPSPSNHERPAQTDPWLIACKENDTPSLPNPSAKYVSPDSSGNYPEREGVTDACPREHRGCDTRRGSIYPHEI